MVEVVFGICERVGKFFSNVGFVVTLLVATKQLYMLVCPLVRSSVCNLLFQFFSLLGLTFAVYTSLLVLAFTPWGLIIGH